MLVHAYYRRCINGQPGMRGPTTVAARPLRALRCHMTDACNAMRGARKVLQAYHHIHCCSLALSRHSIVVCSSALSDRGDAS